MQYDFYGGLYDLNPEAILGSWHEQFRDSPFIFIGGLPYELTEGDLLSIFSQYGEPFEVRLVRDRDTGKSKGFAFLGYVDQRSTILAVDNLNGAKLLGRVIRVDHASRVKRPKEEEEQEDPDVRRAREQLFASAVNLNDPVSEAAPIDEFRHEKSIERKNSRHDGKDKDKDKRTPEEKAERKRLKKQKHDAKRAKRESKKAQSKKDQVELQPGDQIVRADDPEFLEYYLGQSSAQP